MQTLCQYKTCHPVFFYFNWQVGQHIKRLCSPWGYPECRHASVPMRLSPNTSTSEDQHELLEIYFGSVAGQIKFISI